MKVILAQSSGFCFGVKRALDLALEAARQEAGKRPVYTDGPLIHNPQALAVLQELGIKPVEAAMKSSHGVIIIRSHGITPQRHHDLEATGATVIDATCPRVQKVQSIVKEHADQGYTVIIVGDEHHAEVKGLLGHAGRQGISILHEEDIPDLPPETRLCVVAQTTQNRKRFLELAGIIRKRFAGTVVFDTICNANRRRQEELLKICPIVDAIVVIGGKASGNTKRLAEIARATGVPTFFAETKNDLELESLQAYSTVGVTGGASTPAWVLEDVVRTLESAGQEKT